MSVVEVLEQLGGVARRGHLLEFVDRGDLDRAVEVGDVVRDGWGRYALCGADVAVRTAAALGGVVGLLDAALHHGWAVKTVPTTPHVVLGRGRRVADGAPPAIICRSDLRADQVDGHWTARETTLEHCLRRLPFVEALCVADSARREGVGRDVFDRMAADARGPGSAQLKRVAAACTPLAANPFESAARGIALDVVGLSVRPQVRLAGLGARADLVDERLRIVIECDSFEWHGKRSALNADARRYNAMVADGWIVLRLCYVDVMHRPDEVRELLIRVVALAEMLHGAVLALGSRPAAPARAMK